MFQNSYQNGAYFEVLDPKVPEEKTKNLIKTNCNNLKVFDKVMKSYIWEMPSPTSKFSIPKDEKKELALIQQYLNLEIMFGFEWSIEITTTDLNKTKRRIILSSAVHKIDKKPFFVKSPANVKEGIWTYLCIDLHSFMSAFKGQTYRCMDSLHLAGVMKIRRIFTTHSPFPETLGDDENIGTTLLLPKQFYFPPEIEFHSTLLRFSEIPFDQSQISQVSLISSGKMKTKTPMKSKYSLQDESLNKSAKSSAKKKSDGGKFSEEKSDEKSIEESVEKSPENVPEKNTLQSPEKVLEKSNQKVDQKNAQIGYKKERNFLASTNIVEMGNSRRKLGENSSSASKEEIKSFKTIENSTNNKFQKQTLNKTQVPPKPFTNSTKANHREIEKIKTKANPWRSVKKTTSLGVDALPSQKIEKEEHNCPLKPNKTDNVFNKTAAVHHLADSSDYSYVGLSQKFCTVTETRFFPNHPELQTPEKEASDEIEENIEIESTSFYEPSGNKVEPSCKITEQSEDKEIENGGVSFVDSLDQPPCTSPFMDNSSNLNFTDKLLSKFTSELQRPYSPPLTSEEVENEDVNSVEVGKEHEVEVVYDPVLNCYYDCKTGTYYEAKN